METGLLLKGFMLLLLSAGIFLMGFESIKLASAKKRGQPEESKHQRI